MIEQIGIAVFGLIAIALTQSDDAELRPFACFFGLAAQPFWFLITWRAKQWGMFVLSGAYAGLWLMGLWNFWLIQAAPK
jgi:hypothetical protein